MRRRTFRDLRESVQRRARARTELMRAREQERRRLRELRRASGRGPRTSSR